MVHGRYIGPARKQKFDHWQISTPAGYSVSQRIGNIGAGIEQRCGLFDISCTYRV